MLQVFFFPRAIRRPVHLHPFDSRRPKRNQCAFRVYYYSCVIRSSRLQEMLAVVQLTVSECDQFGPTWNRILFPYRCDISCLAARQNEAKDSQI